MFRSTVCLLTLALAVAVVIVTQAPAAEPAGDQRPGGPPVELTLPPWFMA